MMHLAIRRVALRIPRHTPFLVAVIVSLVAGAAFAAAVVGDQVELKATHQAGVPGGGFEVDHILPRSRGGRTEMVNVALACLHCNAHKWAYSDGEDPVSGQRVAPFNPRTQRWEEHLQWSVHRSFAIVGISTHGRTTVARLQMSHPNLVSIRCLLAALGISWKVEAYRDRGSLGHHFCCKNRFE
jgi:HNH endonuclease